MTKDHCIKYHGLSSLLEVLSSPRDDVGNANYVVHWSPQYCYSFEYNILRFDLSKPTNAYTSFRGHPSCGPVCKQQGARPPCYEARFQYT